VRHDSSRDHDRSRRAAQTARALVAEAAARRGWGAAVDCGRAPAADAGWGRRSARDRGDRGRRRAARAPRARPPLGGRCEATHSRTGRAGPHWFDVVAGALLILEAAHSAHQGGKPFYARPAFLAGIATATIGLFHHRIAQLSWKRREIRLDEQGVHARTSRFRRFHVEWADVRDIRVTENAIVIDTASRSHTIPLRRYRNAAEIRTAFSQWDAARALPDASETR
jgi:hypothetical protein